MLNLLAICSIELTLSYYKLINEGIRDALGGVHGTEIVMYSVDFNQINQL